MMKISSLASVLLIAALVGCGPPRSGTEHVPARGALGPYSGMVSSGDFVFVSGKIGERGGTFEHEVNTCLDAVAAQLAEQGLSLADVVLANVYLTDLDQYPEFNAIYAERLPEPYPARACVEVSRLPGDARVEVQVIARRSSSHGK